MLQKQWIICILISLTIILLVPSKWNHVNGSQYVYINIKITDDQDTPQPIEGATVLVWDWDTLEKPSPGRGIYITDKNGECNVSGSYVVLGHRYRVYAYKANFVAETACYYPVTYNFALLHSVSSYNLSLRLLPGALVTLKGIIYSVHASGLGGSFSATIVNPQSGSPLFRGTSNLAQYDVFSRWFLLLDSSHIIAPADLPFKLKVETALYLKEAWMKGYRKDITLDIDDSGQPFYLEKGDKIVIDLSARSLRESLGEVRGMFQEVTSLLDDAQNSGFMVFEERDSLAKVEQKIDDEAQRYLSNREYEKTWVALRTAFTNMNIIYLNIHNMRSVSSSSAIYLPSVLSVFAIILAFFLFEEKRRKIILGPVIYAVFLIVFFFIYPGVVIILNEGITLFLASIIMSFIATMAIVFGVPRIWKEREVEGEVSLRSAAATIFSIGKRQIKRKKIRGFFTILSMALLILAFTSLTSFGAVYGIISEIASKNPFYDGILVKRLVNVTSVLPLPLDFHESENLPKVLRTKFLAPRIENWPTSEPFATLVSPVTGKSVPLYGLLGIDIANESMFTNIDDIIVKGESEYLTGNEVLISMSLANALGVHENEDVHLYIAGVERLMRNLAVKGLFGDEEYMSLTDIDGQSFGPLRFFSDGSLEACNSTEVILMNWRTLVGLQQEAKVLMGEEAPQFVMLSKIVFQPLEWSELDSIVNMLVLVFDYNMYVSFDGIITHYYLGTYMEAKGAMELIIPLVMVGLNVGTVMLNAVYERRKEIRVLSMLGLNPAHISATFVAEAITIGMVGGSLGYLFGLGFYRVMALFEQGFMVREKLDWWWSAIAFAIALSASVISAIRPAMLAVSMYTPSKVRRLKISEKEKETRKEDFFKSFQARETSMAAKVKMNEMPFFINFILNRLEDLMIGTFERTEDIEDLPEIESVNGEIMKSIRFRYLLTISGEKRGTKNELIGVKSPDEDYYRIKLICEPIRPGIPMVVINETINLVHDLVIEWVKNKKRILGVD